MKNYKVILKLMVDPTKGDEAFNRTYYVEAENELKAYSKAQDEQSKDEEVKHRSTLSYTATEISRKQ